MSAIPKELFGLKVEVVRSKRKTSALHIIGDELQIEFQKSQRWKNSPNLRNQKKMDQK